MSVVVSGAVSLQLGGPRLLVVGPWLLELGGLVCVKPGDGGAVVLCGSGSVGLSEAESV